jgi:hypothetical protein
LQVLPSLSASQDGLIVVWETTIALNFWFLLRVAVILLLFVLPNQNIQKFISTNLHWCVHKNYFLFLYVVFWRINELCMGFSFLCKFPSHSNQNFPYWLENPTTRDLAYHGLSLILKGRCQA